MVANQGTAVRRISLDRENVQNIEGKVGVRQIVVITKYVKKILNDFQIPNSEFQWLPLEFGIRNLKF